jgi:CRISPR-associated protein Cas5d
VRRNEVGKVASPRSDGIFIEDDRQQRAGLFLRDVKYRLYASFDFIALDKRGKVHNPVPEWLVDAEETEVPGKSDVRQDETEAKYAAMFERRARKGQCFNQPYLGCREFSAEFRLVNPVVEPVVPIPETRDLGWMLYDMDFTDLANPKPEFFHAKMENGVIITDRNQVEVRS